jgi:hypothetical protein
VRGLGAVQLFDIVESKLVGEHRESRGEVNAVCTDLTHNFAYATKEIVRVFDMRTTTLNTITSFNTMQVDTNAIDFSPCQRFISIAGTNNSCVICDLRKTTRPLHVLQHDAVQGVDGVGIVACKW